MALLARNQAYLKELEGEVKDSQAYPYDVTAIETAPTVFNQIQADLGAVNILVYNAGSGLFGNLDIRVGCEAVW